MKTWKTIRHATISFTATVASCLVGHHATAASFSDSFTTGINPTNWLVSSDCSLFSVTDSGGSVVISKPSGPADDYGFYYTVVACHVVAQGDFTAQINFTNADIDLVSGLADQVQLNCRFGGQDFLVVRDDEYYEGQTAHVWLNPPAQNYGYDDTTATSGTLKIVRTGTLVSGYFDSTLLYQGNFNTNDATFSFVVQNNDTYDAISAGFGDFQLTADNLAVTPPPLTIQPQGTNCVVSWPDRSWPDVYFNTNTLQTISNLSATNWQANFPTPINGVFSYTNLITPGSNTFFRLKLGP
jgi:hypothetical protein